MAKRGNVEDLPEFTALDSSQQAAFNKKVKKKKQEIDEKATEENKPKWNEAGVVYLGHIPHGFYEEQMWQYFGQFGDVNRLKLSRSKKTGRSKGYAFIEFKSEAVAKVVAETMNNYLMFKRLLKCQFLPMTSVHPKTFSGSNRPFTEPKSSEISAKRHNAPQTNQQKRRAVQKRNKRLQKCMKKLSDMGVDYDLASFVKKEPEKTSSEDTSKARKETAAALGDAVLGDAEVAKMEKEAYELLNEEAVSDDEGVGEETASDTADDDHDDADSTSKIKGSKKTATPKRSKKTKDSPVKSATPKQSVRQSARKKKKS